MYSNNKLWEWGLGSVTDYGTLINWWIWHQFMNKTIDTGASALRSIDIMNVVITTKLVTKCIFLNFGAIPKRMVKSAKLNSQKLKLQCRVHKNLFTKIKLNKVFTKKQQLKN